MFSIQFTKLKDKTWGKVIVCPMATTEACIHVAHDYNLQLTNQKTF